MSRAFVKEDGGEGPEESFLPKYELPLDARHYVTPWGLNALRAELQRRSNEDRPALAGRLAAAIASCKDLEIPPLKRQQLDNETRIHYLSQRVQNARTVDSARRNPARAGTVYFGATVAYRAPGGDIRTVRIVGLDEAAASPGAKISFLSPLAKALIGAHVGDSALFHAPAGAVEIEILEVLYEPES